MRSPSGLGVGVPAGASNTGHGVPRMTRPHALLLSRWVECLYLQGYRYAETLEKARERAKELRDLEQHQKHEERYP